MRATLALLLVVRRRVWLVVVVMLLLLAQPRHALFMLRSSTLVRLTDHQAQPAQVQPVDGRVLLLPSLRDPEAARVPGTCRALPQRRQSLLVLLASPDAAPLLVLVLVLWRSTPRSCKSCRCRSWSTGGGAHSSRARLG